jgi:Ca2+ transporting ATPase
MCVNYTWTCFKSGNFREAMLSMKTVQQLISNFIVGVSIIVMSVPEGLPLSVTIALAYSVGKMKEENNLVRYLHACETMGGADNVCSDKTGTLTKNQMTVTKLFIQGQQINTNALPSPLTTPELTNVLIHGICQNSTANPIIEIGNNQQIGNKTECASLELAFRLGYDYKKVRNKDRIIVSYPFSSARKKMTTIYRADDGVYVFCKGAPEFVVPFCSHYINAEGLVCEADDKWRNSIDKVITANASECLRNLYYAFKKLPEEVSIPLQFQESKGAELETIDLKRSKSKKSGIEIIEEIDLHEKAVEVDPTFSDNPQGLIGLAMVGIKDPIRDEIPDAVRKCHEAGVTVRMVTGDNKETAFAIAKEAGILDKNADLQRFPYMCMEGKDFRKFVGGLKNEGTKEEGVGNLENFKLVDAQLRVLARSSPDDKYILATGLKQLGHVVAMTGDGTNDAPALKKADIGFAMGITGTEVAKDAAGIILLDDNFKR